MSIPEAVIQTTFSETEAASPRNLVTLDPEVIAGTAQPSLDGLLETVPGIDARQRGPWGTQTDLSIRGGSFEQVALWVDGIRWSAPHTAHHLLNLPIDPEDIQRVQVVRGGSGALGSGGVTGGIVLHTGPGDADETAVSVEAGSYGWNRVRVRHDWGEDQTRHRISISRAATDGFRDNTDLAMTRARYAGRTVTDKGTFNLRRGHGLRLRRPGLLHGQLPPAVRAGGPLARTVDLAARTPGLGCGSRRAPPEPQRPVRALPRGRGLLRRGRRRGPDLGRRARARMVSGCQPARVHRIRRPGWRPSGHRLGGNLDLRRLPPGRRGEQPARHRGLRPGRQQRLCAGRPADQPRPRNRTTRRTRTPHRPRPRRVERELRRGWPPLHPGGLPVPAHRRDRPCRGLRLSPALRSHALLHRLVLHGGRRAGQPGSAAGGSRTPRIRVPPDRRSGRRPPAGPLPARLSPLGTQPHRLGPLQRVLHHRGHQPPGGQLLRSGILAVGPSHGGRPGPPLLHRQPCLHGGGRDQHRIREQLRPRHPQHEGRCHPGLPSARRLDGRRALERARPQWGLLRPGGRCGN